MFSYEQRTPNISARSKDPKSAKNFPKIQKTRGIVLGDACRLYPNKPEETRFLSMTLLKKGIIRYFEYHSDISKKIIL